MAEPPDPRDRPPSTPDALAELSLEVRPALNAILGYAELLLREEGARLTPHGRRDLGTIQANAKNVLTLLGDLLDISRMETNRAEPRLEELRLDAIVDEAVATARGLLRGKEVDLTAELDPAALFVKSDRHLLRRMIDRLLATAARWTERGEILLSARRTGDALELVVEDTGVGVGPARLPELFERLHGTAATAEDRRISIDLAIVRQSARLLGGDATATSELGRGTKVRVVLPGAITADATEQGPASARPGPAPRPSDLGTHRSVLVVDEDPLLLAELRTMLVDRGFAVVESASASGAIDLARREVPSAILLTVHPPSLAGVSLLEELKTDPALAHVPVVLLAIGEARGKAFLFGPCEFLAEPVQPQELTAVAVRALGGTNGPVLVLEPDAEKLHGVAATLEDAGLAVVRARDVAAATARAERWGLVVANLATPDTGAFTLLAHLRGSGQNVPFVALTPRTISDANARNLKEGFGLLAGRHGSASKTAFSEAEALLRAARVGEGRVPRLLYVEDSPQNRDIVRRYLRGLFEVLEAEDGEAGVECAKREQPDVILMDLSLPEIDGWEATARIKALPPLARTPIIALSAHAGREDRERARVAGCVDYLTKPIERNELVQTLRRHLVRR